MHFLKVLAGFVGKTLSFILVLKSKTQIFYFALKVCTDLLCLVPKM